MQAEGNNMPLVLSFQELSPQSNYCFKYDSGKEIWTKYSCNDQECPNIEIISTLTTLTLNVLTDVMKDSSYRQNMMHAEERYTYILKKTGQLSPEIITFNEVTQNFYNMLKSASWVKNNYWISDLTIEKKGFGNVICSKNKPIFVDKIPIEQLTRTVQAIFIPIRRLDSKASQYQVMCFCSLHLIATPKHEMKREYQFSALVKYLSRYDKIVSAYVIQGDMNFHDQSQNHIFKTHEYKDAWLQKFPNIANHPGYTFDSLENNFINELYWGFQKKRMRLDRVLFKVIEKEQSKNNLEINIDEIKVEFDQPLHGEKQQVERYKMWKGGLMALGDLFGLDTRQKESYLYPSDHYGLISKMAFK